MKNLKGDAMTEIANQDAVQLNQYQTHFCLVSDQPAANFLPIIYYKPKAVVLVVSPEKRNQAVVLTAALEKSRPGIQIERIDIDSAYDVNSTLMEIWKGLDRYKEEGFKPIVNLTGGTKPMSIAALQAASAANCTAFYLDADKNVITIFQAGALDGEIRIPAIEFKPNLEHYLETYGYASNFRDKAQKKFSAKELELVRELATKREIRDAIPFMNKFVSEAEGTNITSGLGKAMQEPGNLKYRSGIEVWIREFEKAGYVRWKGEELSFPDEESRFFAAGGWLEEFVAYQIRELGIDPWVNLEIRKNAKAENVKNEIDVAFLKNGHLYIVECKTSKMADKRVANETVYKLETLGKVGGLSTKLILVSYQKVNPDARRRARSSGITVFNDNQIPNLKSWLEGVIQ